MLWQENCPCDKIWLPVCSQWPVNDWPEDNLENSFGARFFTGELVNGIPLGVSLRPVLAELERTFRMEKRICSNSRTESFFPFLLFDPADNGRPAPGTERRFEIPPSIVLKTTTTTTTRNPFLTRAIVRHPVLQIRRNLIVVVVVAVVAVVRVPTRPRNREKTVFKSVLAIQPAKLILPGMLDCRETKETILYNRSSCFLFFFFFFIGYFGIEEGCFEGWIANEGSAFYSYLL